MAKKPASNAAKSNIHAFVGTDEAKGKEAALKLSRELVPPDNADFGLEVVSGQADNSDHAARIVSETIQALQTLPFFGGDKVVWLQGANFLGDSVTGRASATLEAVEALTSVLEAGLPGEVQFILNASEIDKRRSFYKKLGKMGHVEVFDKVDISREGWETKVMGEVAARARELGLKFENGALERFVLLVGADTRQLESELEKLYLYTGGKKSASIEDVRAIVASTHAGVIFEIGDAIAQRNLKLALELVDTQLRRGENAIGLLLAAVVPRVRSMLQAKDIVERHRLSAGRNYRQFESEVNRLPETETAHLPRKKDGGISCYPLFLAAQQCGRFTLPELKDALDACLRANLRLVTTQLDPRLVLHQLIAQILAKPANQKPPARTTPAWRR